ncbi:MAG: hypothetical protein JXK94_11005 [Deltaproteobacteria bacterium]|nr:hypothetical protein [Deltaproteobacteria bacterium]
MLQVHEVKHADIKTVLPVVENFLEKGETVQNMKQKLIINATPESQKKIRQFLDQIDVPRKTLMIEVKQLKSSIKNAVRVGSSSSKPVYAGTRLGNTRSSVTQHIMVLDGEDAFIVVGEDIPYTSELAMVNGRNQGFYQKTDYKKTRTGFVVRPNLRGKMVEVQIIPFQESPRNQRSAYNDTPPMVDYQQASTRLQVPLGSWFDVGGTSYNSDQDDLGTIHWSTGKRTKDSSVQLRIQVPSSNFPTN